MTQSPSSGEAFVNVTVQNDVGYDNYGNSNGNYPTSSSFAVRVPTAASDDTVFRAGMYFGFQKITSGTTPLQIRLGFNRRAGSVCSALSAVMFDGSQSTQQLHFLSLSLPLLNKVFFLCRWSEHTYPDLHNTFGPVWQQPSFLSNCSHCLQRGAGSDLVVFFVMISKSRFLRK